MAPVNGPFMPSNITVVGMPNMSSLLVRLGPRTFLVLITHNNLLF